MQGLMKSTTFSSGDRVKHITCSTTTFCTCAYQPMIVKYYAGNTVACERFDGTLVIEPNDHNLQLDLWVAPTIGGTGTGAITLAPFGFTTAPTVKAVSKEEVIKISPIKSKVCECGAIKCNTGHATWCDLYAG